MYLFQAFGFRHCIAVVHQVCNIVLHIVHTHPDCFIITSFSCINLIDVVFVLWGPFPCLGGLLKFRGLWLNLVFRFL